MRILIIALSLLAACASAKHEVEEERKKNVLRGFVGATTKGDRTEASFAAIYERRLTHVWAVGLVVEFTPSLQERLVTVPSLFIHPYKGLALTVAPGVEVEDDEVSFLVRLGAAWDFELGEGWSIAPELNIDLVEGGEDIPFVYGLSLGKDF
ncbi:MAG: hypothetical protein ACYTEG_10580 [Planctomycetota bacterium]|jgi:hypothetical protein